MLPRPHRTKTNTPNSLPNTNQHTRETFRLNSSSTFPKHLPHAEELPLNIKTKLSPDPLSSQVQIFFFFIKDNFVSIKLAERQIP